MGRADRAVQKVAACAVAEDHSARCCREGACLGATPKRGLHSDIDRGAGTARIAQGLLPQPNGIINYRAWLKSRKCFCSQPGVDIRLEAHVNSTSAICLSDSHVKTAQRLPRESNREKGFAHQEIGSFGLSTSATTQQLSLRIHRSAA